MNDSMPDSRQDGAFYEQIRRKILAQATTLYGACQGLEDHGYRVVTSWNSASPRIAERLNDIPRTRSYWTASLLATGDISVEPVLLRKGSPKPTSIKALQSLMDGMEEEAGTRVKGDPVDETTREECQGPNIGKRRIADTPRTLYGQRAMKAPPVRRKRVPISVKATSGKRPLRYRSAGLLGPRDEQHNATLSGRQYEHQSRLPSRPADTLHYDVYPISSSDPSSGTVSFPQSSYDDTASREPDNESAMARMTVLIRRFREEYMPQCLTFISKTPYHEVERQAKYTRLSQTILTRVLLELDGVEVSENNAARERRRKFAGQVQEWLDRLDEVMVIREQEAHRNRPASAPSKSSLGPRHDFVGLSAPDDGGHRLASEVRSPRLDPKSAQEEVDALPTTAVEVASRDQTVFAEPQKHAQFSFSLGQRIQGKSPSPPVLQSRIGTAAAHGLQSKKRSYRPFVQWPSPKQSTMSAEQDSDRIPTSRSTGVSPVRKPLPAGSSVKQRYIELYRPQQQDCNNLQYSLRNENDNPVATSGKQNDSSMPKTSPLKRRLAVRVTPKSRGDSSQSRSAGRNEGNEPSKCIVSDAAGSHIDVLAPIAGVKRDLDRMPGDMNELSLVPAPLSIRKHDQPKEAGQEKSRE